MINLSQSERNPWLSLVLVMLFTIGGLFIFQIVSILLILPFLDYGLSDIGVVISNPTAYPDFKTPLLIIQGITSTGAFILTPLYYIWRFENANFEFYFNKKDISLFPLVIAAILVLVFMVVNSVFIEWNLNLEFPGSFGTWARAKEDQLQLITEYITNFDSTSYFVLSIVVVAIVPAIGEELLFRGLIQKTFEKISGNVHLAIWISAILFSAFHMQFFGFIPRLLLGAFFGYLYVFSGNLSYAILAHFVNNGFTLWMVYLHQQDTVKFDIEDTESIPLESVAIFFIIGAVLFYFFHKQFINKEQPLNG